MAVTLPCPAEHWPLFSSLLDKALSLPDTGYEAWLAALEGESATLRPWLARVLAAAAAPATGGFLDTPALLADTGFEAGFALESPFGSCAGSARVAWARYGWPIAPRTDRDGRWP